MRLERFEAQDDCFGEAEFLQVLMEVLGEVGLVVAERNHVGPFAFDVQQIILRHASHNLIDLRHAADCSHAFGQCLCRPAFFEAVHHVVTPNHHGKVLAVFFCLFHKRPMPRVEQVEGAEDEHAGHGFSLPEFMIVDLANTKVYAEISRSFSFPGGLP